MAFGVSGLGLLILRVLGLGLGLRGLTKGFKSVAVMTSWVLAWPLKQPKLEDGLLNPEPLNLSKNWQNAPQTSQSNLPRTAAL